MSKFSKVLGCLSLSMIMSCSHHKDVASNDNGQTYEEGQAPQGEEQNGADRSPAGSRYNYPPPNYNYNNNDPRYRNNDPRYANNYNYNNNYNNDPRYRNNDPRYNGNYNYNNRNYNNDRNYNYNYNRNNNHGNNYGPDYNYGYNARNNNNNNKSAKKKNNKNDKNSAKNYKWYDPDGSEKNGKPEKLGISHGCNLDQIAGVTIGGGVSVLQVFPRILKNGSITGGDLKMVMGQAPNGQAVQSLMVDLRGDRALLTPYFTATNGDFSDLQSAINDAASGAFDGESSYKPVYTPQKAVHALNSAMSFINGNYTTVALNPKRTGHVMAAALAAIMATIDYPGCADYFIAEAGKVMSPEHAAYLNDFPFNKIRDARKNHSIGSDFAELGKRREQIREDINTVDGLLAHSETNNETRLKQVERLLKVELEGLKAQLYKFPPCQTVLAYEMTVFDPTKKTEVIAESWVNRCRDAIEDRATEISARLLSMAAEREVLLRQNEIFKQQMDAKSDEGAKKIMQGKIDANVKKMEGFDALSPKLETEKQLIETYRAEIPLRGGEVQSSINLELDKISALSEEQRKRRGSGYFNDDHKRMTELRNSYYSVTRDYVTLGMFGGAQQDAGRSPGND